MVHVSRTLLVVYMGGSCQRFLERFQFNVEVVLDRYYLEKIKQKTTEDYCEYASR